MKSVIPMEKKKGFSERRTAQRNPSCDTIDGARAM